MGRPCIAIMQPTYLPWLGILAMIEKVDQFVFLDNVQFHHRSWQQRNRIKTDRGELWLTVSVKKSGLSEQKINQVKCLDLKKDSRKHLQSIAHYYSKAPFYKNFYSELSREIETSQTNSNDFLCNFNINLINFLCKYAGIEKKFILSSQMPVTGIKDGLLADICENLGAKSYLSAPGSQIYLENSKEFQRRGIKIVYHEYDPPKYPQLYGEFLPGLSSIDAFFNVKKEKLKDLIVSGCK